MLQIHHFTFGPWTPALAVLASVTGSLLGLQCTARARVGTHRAAWLATAAVSIGGAGIWVTHFVAMLGFSINNVTIRYNMPLTLLSAAIGIGVVGLGLFVVGLPRRPGPAALLAGGAVTGCGVAAMHYTGMAALSTDAVIGYDAGIVGVSVAVAVVAATAALWFTVRVEGLPAAFGAALIMGLAVCGMHYTGMAAMTAHLPAGQVTAHGTDPFALLAPLILIVSVITATLLIVVGTTDHMTAPDAGDNVGIGDKSDDTTPGRHAWHRLPVHE